MFALAARDLCFLYIAVESTPIGEENELRSRVCFQHGGRLCVCGSTMIFHDTYLEKEQNRRLLVMSRFVFAGARNYRHSLAGRGRGVPDESVVPFE